MIKTAEALVMFSLFLVVFFAGVNYSDTVKSKASWLFEKEEAEVDLTKIKHPNQEVENVVVDQEPQEELVEPIYASPTHTMEEDFAPETTNQKPDINDQIPVIPAQ